MLHTRRLCQHCVFSRLSAFLKSSFKLSFPSRDDLFQEIHSLFLRTPVYPLSSETAFLSVVRSFLQGNTSTWAITCMLLNVTMSSWLQISVNVSSDPPSSKIYVAVQTSMWFSAGTVAKQKPPRKTTEALRKQIISYSVLHPWHTRYVQSGPSLAFSGF